MDVEINHSVVLEKFLSSARKEYLRRKYTRPVHSCVISVFELSNDRRNDGHTITWECDEVENTYMPFARLYLRWNNGYLVEISENSGAVNSGWGSSPREAYRECLRQQRLSQHNTADLLRDLNKHRKMANTFWALLKDAWATINEMRAAALDIPVDQLDSLLS